MDVERGDKPDCFPRYRDPVDRVCGLLIVIATLLALQVILGLFG